MTQANSTETQPTHLEHGKDLAEFLQADNGKYSTMRAMSFVALIASVVFGAMTMTGDDAEGKYITTVFLVGAFAPKAVQRFAENQVS